MRGRCATRSTSCCFVSLFPQLVAGPIVRYARRWPSSSRQPHASRRRSSPGASRSSRSAWRRRSCSPTRWRYVADARLRRRRAAVARRAGSASCAYAFQIYFDFSGYSDMAVGLGADARASASSRTSTRPTAPTSITDFWRRWHISLSTWLRDYLYIPLGGNRRGPSRTYVNLLLMMLLGGLWHGAAWTFVIWGAIHGTLLAVERARGRAAIYGGLPRPAADCADVRPRRASPGCSSAPTPWTAPGPTCARWWGRRRCRRPRSWPARRSTRRTTCSRSSSAACSCGRAPQAWTLTQRLTAPRAALCLAVLGRRRC